jgi:cation diffusion facilitator family transporter
MRIREPFHLPEDARQKFERAVRLERISLVVGCVIVVLVYGTIGQSQAMKAVFAEDLLGIVPPIAFLISARMRWREPNKRFPYGYHHTVSVGFFCSAVAILALGGLIFFDSAMTLIKGEHPTIGAIAIFGHQMWLGWLMYPVLIVTAFAVYILGRLKLPLALELHDKALAADARMNRADWMTGAGAVLGITGVAYGWWWLDSVVACLISIEIVRDGWENLSAVVADLLDERPTKPLESTQPEEWEPKLCDRVKRLDWVRSAEVRLREEGNLLTGEVYVVPSSLDNFPKRYDEVQKIARDLNWRFYDLGLVAVDEL